MNTKRCSKCWEIKPMSAFYHDRTHGDGHESQCKACTDAYDREYRRAYMHPPEMTGSKRCSTCKVIKPVTEFFADRTMKIGRASQCKACANAGRRTSTTR